MFAALGIDQHKYQTEPRLMPSSTKRGPGRKHKQGDGTRTSEQRQAGAFGRGLRNHLNRQNLKRCKRVGPTDRHGAVTLIGKPHPYQAPNLLHGGKRVWLGGISAQRGY